MILNLELAHGLQQRAIEDRLLFVAQRADCLREEVRPLCSRIDVVFRRGGYGKPLA